MGGVCLRLQGVTYPGPMVMSPDYSTNDSLFSLQYSMFYHRHTVVVSKLSVQTIVCLEMVKIKK